MVAKKKKKGRKKIQASKHFLTQGDVNIEIPIGDLVYDAPDRNDEDYATVKGLAQSMKRMGQITPIVVVPDDEEPGKYNVVAGKRRVAAAEMAKIKTLRAVEVDGDDDAIALAILADNIQRRDPSPLLQAQLAQHLLENGDFNGQADVATHLGVSQSWISRLLQILELPDDMQEKVAKKEIPVSVAVDGTSEVRKKAKKKGKSAKESEKELEKAISEATWKRLPKDFFIPEDSDKPVESLACRVSAKEVEFKVTMSLSKATKNGIVETIKEEVEKVGDGAIRKALRKFRKTEF